MDLVKRIAGCRHCRILSTLRNLIILIWYLMADARKMSTQILVRYAPWSVESRGGLQRRRRHKMLQMPRTSKDSQEDIHHCSPLCSLSRCAYVDQTHEAMAT